MSKDLYMYIYYIYEYCYYICQYYVSIYGTVLIDVYVIFSSVMYMNHI